METKIIEIDLAELTIEEKAVPEEYEHLGGRGLTSTIISREVEPTCHPLSEDNMLVIAPGLLAGTTFSSSNRLSVGAKSPLTGGIKESNSGGVVAYKLGRLGIKAIKLQGRSKSESGPIGIRIDKNGVYFEDLAFLEGKTTYYSAEKLLEKYVRKAGLMVIGPAGEMKLSTACINVNDQEGEPCRNIGRGGLGAVMGSKGVKAIIVDDAGIDSLTKQNDKAKEVIKKFASMLKEHPVTGEEFAKYGTVMTLMSVNTLGGLPTRNFSQGSFEQAENIGAERLYETISERGGMYTHSCMPGCVIRCSNKYVDENGNPVVGSLDYETVCLLGANLGLANLDQIATLNKLCNTYGIDTMETGVALGVVAEAGVMKFGDFDRAKELIEEIGKGTVLGRLIGSGSVVCGKVFGVERVPAVKNQGMGAYDPRAIKGMGVTYSLSPMGADHTAGNAITLAVDHLDPQSQLEPVRDLNINTMVLDSLGVCIFTGRVTLQNPEILEEMIAAFLGWNVTFEVLRKMGKNFLLREREFNRRAGFTRAHDRVPEFMKKENLLPNNSVFDISEEELDKFYDFANGELT